MKLLQSCRLCAHLPILIFSGEHRFHVLSADQSCQQYLLADLGDNEAEPIVDQLSVSDGMETALASYLADELSAPVGSGTQGFWREGSSTNLSTPNGTIPLADFVTGAPALTASLAGVGIVEDAASAEALQFSLLPGQAVATKAGGLWRWDGFVRQANQSNKSAERIRQRRRLKSPRFRYSFCPLLQLCQQKVVYMQPDMTCPVHTTTRFWQAETA